MNIAEITQHDLDELEKQLDEKMRNENDLKPFLEKVQGREDIFNAVMNDKLDPEVVKGILDGTATKAEVKQAAKNADVPTGLAEQVRSLIAEELSKADGKIGKVDKLSEDFEAIKLANEVRDFAETVPDFDEYREGIANWYDEHPEFESFPLDNVYKMVKYEKLSAEASSKVEEDMIEEQKMLAARGGNGAGHGAVGTKEGFEEALMSMAKTLR
ncbi:MAG: hypothetical protein WC455_10680 [Dehalococcoidia bacterium]|jgi:hypothetical protein